MKSRLVRVALPLLCSALALGPASLGPVLAQGATPPAATLTQPPASPAPASPAPAAPDTTAPPVSPQAGTGQPAPPAGAARTIDTAGLPTLVPQSGDTGDVDEVALPAKPVAIMSGQSNWENGLKTIRATFAHIQEELAKAGIQPAGKPLTVFTETSDDGFKFDAMLPVAKPPEGATTVTSEIRFGTTPSGKAYRFVHKGPYDEIDSTYETITAYLDAKDISAKDAFVEEYVTDTADPTDPNLEINIFVQPK